MVSTPIRVQCSDSIRSSKGIDVTFASIKTNICFVMCFLSSKQPNLLLDKNVIKLRMEGLAFLLATSKGVTFESEDKKYEQLTQTSMSQRKPDVQVVSPS